MIISPVQLKETLDSKKETHIIYICTIYTPRILIWVAKIHTQKHQLYRFYISNLLSTADSYFVTTDAFAHHSLCSPAPVLLSCKVGMETTCLSDIPIAQRCVVCLLFNLITLCGMDYFVCLWNYKNFEQLHIVHFSNKQTTPSRLYIKFPSVCFPRGTGTDLLHIYNNSSVLDNYHRHSSF